MLKLSVLLDKLIWLFTLVLFCSFYIFNTNVYARFILLGITGCILALEILRYGKSFQLYWHSFHTYVFIFAFFCLLSYFWSIDPMASLIQTAIIFQILICMSVLYIFFVRQKDITPLLNILIWGGIVICLYTLLFYGLGNVRELVLSARRLDNSFSNVNKIGMLMAISSIVIVYQFLFDKRKWFHIFIVPIIIILAATGSRTSLISVLFGVSIIFFIRYSSKNWVISLFRYFIVILFLFVIFRFLLELPVFEGINKRMETLFNLFTGQGSVDNSAIIRRQMVYVGWQQFLQTPILGTGIGSSGDLLLPIVGWRTYFHNNYVELLACIGVIGTTLYYMIFLVPAFQLFKQRKYHLPNIDICLILIAVLLLADLGGVSYYTKEHYFYIMIFFIQVQINKHCLKEKKLCLK